MDEPAPRWIPASVLTRPGRWLLGLVVASIPFALALARLEIRSDGEALYPSGDAAVERTLADRERFRDPEALFVLVSARADSDRVLTPAGLDLVESLTARLRAVRGVRSDGVASIATVIDVDRSTGSLRLERFLERRPATAADVEEIERGLDRDGIYRGFLFGRDGRSALILAPLVPRESRVGTVRRVQTLVRGLDRTRFDVRLTGPVVAEVMLGEQIFLDLVRLVPLVVGVVAVALLLCLRSAGGAMIPLVEMLFVLLWTFGAMAMFRVPLTLVTSVLPVLLMAMAVTDVLHLLERFQSRLEAGAPRVAALRHALAEVGPAIVRTSITTAIGFLSFLATSVPPMRHFGAFAGLGLLLAMVFSFTLVPAVMMLLPERWLRRAGREPARPRGGFEAGLADHPRAAALVGVAIVAAALTGLPRLSIEDSWVGNFHPASDLVVAEGILDREYHGSYRLDAVLSGRADGLFLSRRGVALVDSLQAVLAGFPEVSAAGSHVDLLRVAHRGLEPGGEVRRLGDDELAQLVLLLEISGMRRRLDAFVTPDGREARIQCFVRHADYPRSTRLRARVEALRAPLAAQGVDVRATGDLVVASEVVHATVSNQLRSVALTLLGLGVALAVSFRSVGVAAMLLAPVAATTLVVLGGMGHVGIALGVATSMFAALAEGEGVDFAIHIVSRHRQLSGARGEPEALRETLASVGTALRWNCVALVAGCLVLCLSALKPVRALGGLLAFGMAVSYLTSLLFLPALLRLGRARR